MTITVTSMGSNSTNIAFSAGETAANVAAAVETYILTKGWSVHDSAASATSKCYKALCVDGVTYKYALLNWTTANTIGIQVYEGWNASTHVGINLAGFGSVCNQPLTLAVGGNLYVFATARHFAILARSNLGTFGGTTNFGATAVTGGAQGCFEIERANAEDTSTIAAGGISTYTVTIQTSGSFTATGANYYAVPLTGGTGTGAKATVMVRNNQLGAVCVSTPGTGYTIGDQLTFPASSVGGGSASGQKITVTSVGVGVPPFVWLDTIVLGNLVNIPQNNSQFYGNPINESAGCYGGALSFPRTKGGLYGLVASTATGIITPYGFWGTHGNGYASSNSYIDVNTMNGSIGCTFILPSAVDSWTGKYIALDMLVVADTMTNNTHDIRGRLYNIKCLSLSQGITLDTVNVKVDSNGWNSSSGSLTPYYIAQSTSAVAFRFGILG
jgi:hypothetical protein